MRQQWVIQLSGERSRVVAGLPAAVAGAMAAKQAANAGWWVWPVVWRQEVSTRTGAVCSVLQKRRLSGAVCRAECGLSGMREGKVPAVAAQVIVAKARWHAGVDLVLGGHAWCVRSARYETDDSLQVGTLGHQRGIFFCGWVLARRAVKAE